MASVAPPWITKNKVRRTLVTLQEMLRDRKYDMSYFDASDSEWNIDEKVDEILKSPIHSFSIDSCKLTVVYVPTVKFSSKHVKPVLNSIEEHAILITNELPPTGFQSEVKYLETFKINSMVINVTKNALQAKKMYVLSAEETKTLLSTYNTQLKHLPLINITDPIAKYYGMRKDQVICYMRNSPNGGTDPYYRVCVLNKASKGSSGAAAAPKESKVQAPAAPPAVQDANANANANDDMTDDSEEEDEDTVQLRM